MDRTTLIGIAVGFASWGPSTLLALVALVPVLGWPATGASMLVPLGAGVLAAVLSVADPLASPAQQAFVMGAQAGRPAGWLAAFGAVGAHTAVGFVQSVVSDGAQCACIWQLGFATSFTLLVLVLSATISGTLGAGLGGAVSWLLRR